MSSERVSSAMSTNVISVREQDAITEIIHLLEDSRISGVPVVNPAGEYTGVLSKTDLVSRKFLACVQQNPSLANVTVKDFMNTTPPLSVKQDSPIDDAIALMIDYKVHRVFVTDDTGKMIGIISTMDIIKLMRFTFEAYL